MNNTKNAPKLTITSARENIVAAKLQLLRLLAEELASGVVLSEETDYFSSLKEIADLANDLRKTS